MQKSNGRTLHAEAARAREEERFTESLTYNDAALFAYDKEKDSLGFSEGLACRSTTLRVYANLHNSKRILTLAKYEMMASVELARQSGAESALAVPLYNLAQLREDLGELNEAVNDYKEAIRYMQNSPPEDHNRPSVLANMKVHQSVCEYKAGDKSALERAKMAIQELEQVDEASRYNKDVWVSGGYMRLASAIKEDDPNEARLYLAKAKTIIEANPKLTLRMKQWQNLSARI